MVVLRDVYDLPHEAIAAELGISVSAAKVRLHRARRRLREQLYPMPGEPVVRPTDVTAAEAAIDDGVDEASDRRTVPVRCDAVADRLGDVASGSVELDDAERAHVEQCLRCQAELVQYRKLLRTLRALRTEVLDPAPGARRRPGRPRGGRRAAGRAIAAERASGRLRRVASRPPRRPPRPPVGRS